MLVRVYPSSGLLRRISTFVASSAARALSSSSQAARVSPKESPIDDPHLSSDADDSPPTFYFSSSDDEETAGQAPSIPPQAQVLRAYPRNPRARCLSRVREYGLIPAVLMDPTESRDRSKGRTDITLSLDPKPVYSLLKTFGKRDFLSRIFNMEIFPNAQATEVQESLQVIPRNLNYGPGKTNIYNIQFLKAPPGKILTLGVPLEFIGVERCPGLRKGGTFKKLAKFVLYNCEVSSLPAKIVVDMTILEIGDKVRVQDLDVNFDLLHSDRLMPVCEIVKDAATIKSKAKRKIRELHYKRKALLEKDKNDLGQNDVLKDSSDGIVVFGEEETSPQDIDVPLPVKDTTKRRGEKRSDTQALMPSKSQRPSKRRLVGSSPVQDKGRVSSNISVKSKSQKAGRKRREKHAKKPKAEKPLKSRKVGGTFTPKRKVKKPTSKTKSSLKGKKLKSSKPRLKREP